MNNPLRAIVVSKGTVFNQVLGEDHAESGRHTSFWDEVVASHRSHEASLQRTIEVLAELNWTFDTVNREDFRGPDGYDLVITAGGDGTVLSASHRTLGVPLLGVNSDPERSVGYFCATDAAGLADILKAFESNQVPAYVLHRLRIEIDGEEVGPPVLNDVLVANENPAATSRYALIAGTRMEHHRSSGMWISTAAGSTAGIRSAGGAVLPLEVPLLQYLVREPVVSPLSHYELLRGVRELGEGIRVVSEMSHGYAYIDGPYEAIPFGLGAEMRVSAHEPLRIMGLEPSRRER